jgi:GTP-binding protein Era
LGQKLSIVTNKPQTTRKRILGILTENDYQIIFLDTPGMMKPSYLLQEKMMEYVEQSVKDADIFVFIIDAAKDGEIDWILTDERLKETVFRRHKPKVLAVNKIDTVDKKKTDGIIERVTQAKLFDAVIPVSAAQNLDTDKILEFIVGRLPEHPKYYPDDIIADENERFFVSEIIREKIFETYKDEVPYSCEVVIDDFKETEGRKDLIRADIIVERESQKGIIIGKQGNALKTVGQLSREAIEDFLQRPVYLELFVKVRDKWRSSENFLKSFGYNRNNEE